MGLLLSSYFETNSVRLLCFFIYLPAPLFQRKEIERLWEAEEAVRGELYAIEEASEDFTHKHHCPCCNEHSICKEESCVGLRELECDTCIVHESICYVRSINYGK